MSELYKRFIGSGLFPGTAAVKYDPNAEPGKEGAEGAQGGDPNKGGEPTPPPDPPAGEPPQETEAERKLREENEQLRKTIKADKDAKADAERKRLEEEGDYKQLLENERAERQRAEQSAAAEKRRNAILTRHDLKFSPQAVVTFCNEIDAETDGSLSVDDLVEQAQKRMEAAGLAPSVVPVVTNEGGSPSHRGQATDPRFEQYRDAFKSGQQDLFLALQQELIRDYGEERLPRVKAH